jgi:hypothetical protein
MRRVVAGGRKHFSARAVGRRDIALLAEQIDRLSCVVSGTGFDVRFPRYGRIGSTTLTCHHVGDTVHPCVFSIAAP